jgi:hypothetical protein
MSKRFLKVVSLILVILIVSFSMTGCYGKFQLTKKVYAWNGQVGDKFVNSIVMWILYFVPVYGVAGFLDVAVLNVIEFWTGTNPMAMGPDDSEIQLVTVDGRNYEVTATQNRFEIREIGVETDNPVALLYDEQSHSWFVETQENGKVKIAQLDENQDQILHLIDPNGEVTSVDLKKDKILE